MDEVTKKALEESIAKWEQNVEYAKISEFDKIQISWKDCPLCSLYYNQEDNCVGCPVYNNTGRRRCLNTPYHDVVSYIKTTRTCSAHIITKACQAEVDFLKSLLPQTGEST
jgi:hypothetical protein